jgi:hypothetical protein
MEQVLGAHHVELQARAQRVRLQNMHLLSGAAQVAGKLTEARIDYRFLKGPHLSQKIYGDAGLRHSKDLDLLVRRESAVSTVELLQSQGWKLLDGELLLKGGLQRRIAEYRLRHVQLLHQRARIGLELHWRIEAASSQALEEK